jgi:hypothetical protein
MAHSSIMGRRGNKLTHWLIVLLILAINENWCMFRPSNFKEWMTVNFLNLALFTKVKIGTNATFVTNALNWGAITSVTRNSVMHLRSLIGSSLTEVFNH